MLPLFRILFGGDRKGTNLLTQARDQFLEMLDQAIALLDDARPHLLDPDAPGELAERARSVDKSVNRIERNIRKLLVEHLAFDHADAAACLVLMSVAKDGERLVDHCRNLLELRAFLDEPIPERYADDIRALLDDGLAMLRKSRQAFADNDAQKAVELVEGEKPFIGRIKSVEDRLLDDGSLSPRQAVVASRALREIQRIYAHLGNIASTVIFPVHRIDFGKRRFVEDAKRELGLEEDG